MSGYRVFAEDDCPYFVTSTVVGWAHVFTSEPYFELLVDSLRYCQQQKGLSIYSYVVMTHHFHLIARTENSSVLSDVMRDLKRHTSSAIIRQLEREGRQSQYAFFADHGLRRAGNTRAKVWQDGFHPVALLSEAWFEQKLRYIEENPVRKGYVAEPAHWRYSSAFDRENPESASIRLDRMEDWVH